MYRPNASVIAQRFDRKVLIVKKPRNTDAWQFPQGGVEEDESLIEAAYREFIEEVGTDKFEILYKSNITYQYDFPEGYIRYSDDGKEYKGQHVTFFRAIYTGPETDITIDENELEDFKWVNIDDLPEYFDRKEYLDVCLNVIANEE